MENYKRHVAFIDVLGLRRALSTGKVSIAEKKILKLSQIVEETLKSFPTIHAHAATDFVYLLSDKEEEGWFVATASLLIFQKYFALNTKESINDVEEGYMIRGGLAYGEAKQIEKTSANFSCNLSVGNGLANAYEIQVIWPGMRFFVAPNTTKYLKPLPKEELEGICLKIDKIHDVKGNVISREICWPKPFDYAKIYLNTASRLFRASLTAFRKGLIDERIVLHYQQTLCSFLRGISDPKLLIPFLAFRHKQTRFHKFLAPIWATTWYRMIRPQNIEILPEIKHILWGKFLIVAGTRYMGEVSGMLNRRNRWRPLVRFIKGDKLIFGKKAKKLKKK